MKKIAYKLGEFVDAARNKREAFVWGVMATTIWVGFMILIFF